MLVKAEKKWPEKNILVETVERLCQQKDIHSFEETDTVQKTTLCQKKSGWQKKEVQKNDMRYESKKIYITHFN